MERSPSLPCGMNKMLKKSARSLFFLSSLLLFLFLCVPPPALSQTRGSVNPQEITDLKIAVGAYEDGLYKIAATYLSNFLKKYPHSRHRLQVSLLLGNSLKKVGKNHEALKVYQAILNTYNVQNSAILIRIHYEIYQILSKKGEKKRAVSHLKRIVDISSKKKIINSPACQAFLELTEYYRNLNKIPEAQHILDKLLSLNPPDPWREKALLLKISMLATQKRFDDLLSMLSPLIKKMKGPNGNNKTFYLYWAVANLKRNRYCQAQEAYKKLLTFYSDTPTLPSVLTGYVISFFKCFADLNVREQMFQSLEKKFKNRPSILFQIYYLEGLLNYEEGRFEKARLVWTQTLDRFPDHPKVPEILLKLDKIFHQSGDTKTWEALLLKVNKEKRYPLETKEVASLLLGNLYFSQKKYETALPFYFNIINKKRYRRYCLEKIVFCYYYLGKFKEAKTNLGILLLENPQISDQSNILFLQADLALRSNRTEEALRLLKRLVEKSSSKKGKNKEREQFWEQKAKLELGKLYFMRKDYNEAKRYLLEVFRYVSADSMEDNRIAAFYLGLIAMQEKNYELSETYFQIASLSKDPKIRVEALFRRGLSEKKLKNFFESIKTFEMVIREFQDQKAWVELSRLELAKIYIYLHNYVKVTPLLKNLVEKSKDEALKKQAKELLNQIIIKRHKTK